MRDDDLREGTQGEFRGDFTRDTFYPLRHFARVLMQQGRVQLDADWNEQVSILLHYLRSLARDLGSEHWGPTTDIGFDITSGQNDFTISAGHYYVQGILCENNEEKLTYTNQPDYPLNEAEKKLNEGKYLVYLDLWERHLTYIEDDLIREVALAGPDTATRAKIVWQVKLANKLGEMQPGPLKDDYKAFLDVIRDKIKPGSGKLRARARKQKDTDEPCLTSPEARYRGAENQLYRVEIHKGGVAWNGKKKDGGGNQDAAATFKWSRDNGSVIFPIRQLAGTKVVVEHLGRDERSSLRQWDWVEVVDDDRVLRGEVGQLAQVDEIDIGELTVTLKVSPGTNLPDYQENDARHPLLRRWDNKSDAIPVSEGNQEKDWSDLKDGVQIQFQPGATYRTGDNWLIPARTVTGDVEWPGPVDNPTAIPPHGIVHYYAPLAIIYVDANGNITANQTADLRRKLKQLWS